MPLGSSTLEVAEKTSTEFGVNPPRNDGAAPHERDERKGPEFWSQNLVFSPFHTNRIAIFARHAAVGRRADRYTRCSEDEYYYHYHRLNPFEVCGAEGGVICGVGGGRRTARQSTAGCVQSRFVCSPSGRTRHTRSARLAHWSTYRAISHQRGYRSTNQRKCVFQCSRRRRNGSSAPLQRKCTA